MGLSSRDPGPGSRIKIASSGRTPLATVGVGGADVAVGIEVAVAGVVAVGTAVWVGDAVEVGGNAVAVGTRVTADGKAVVAGRLGKVGGEGIHAASSNTKRLETRHIIPFGQSDIVHLLIKHRTRSRDRALVMILYNDARLGSNKSFLDPRKCLSFGAP
jgi:hypothetical protein